MILVLCIGGKSESFSEEWKVITRKEDFLPVEGDKIYSVHWHWKIPPEVYKKFKCIGFHSTDLPYGKGSNPIGRMKDKKFRETMVTAFEITGEYDSGPILMKRELSLTGSKDAVLARAYATCAHMIRYIEEFGYPMYIPQEEYR
jgi:methionyl-tRNA formyltransferase